MLFDLNRLTDQNGRITKVGQEAIYAFEKKYRRHFDQGAAQAFQTAVATVGAKMKGKIEVPEIEKILDIATSSFVGFLLPVQVL